MEKYEELEMEVVEFEAEDVITESNNTVMPEIQIGGKTS